ncbi:11219_t:CDS:2, partial [Dentiscutata heterogama]
QFQLGVSGLVLQISIFYISDQGGKQEMQHHQISTNNPSSSSSSESMNPILSSNARSSVSKFSSLNSSSV